MVIIINIDLKSCPFCGGEAYYSYIGEGDWVVRCFECRAEIKSFMGFSYGSDNMKQGLQKVISKWNKRSI